MKLAGKTVLITGAAKRLGREIALELAKRGANILIHYNRSEKDGRDLQRKILSLRVKAHLVQADFSHQGKAPLQKRIQRFVKDVFSRVKRVDVLINNASIFYPTPFEEVTEKDWDEFLTVNLKVPFFLSQKFGLRMMEQKSGKIIQLVDWVGERPTKRFLPYAISKAGLVAATKGLAKNLAPYIQVIGVAPGPILPVVNATPKERQAASERSLLKRYGHPQDIAKTIRFLIEDTDFITGTIVNVDGGASVS